jgi:sterol desaturase/sphingolipid hydroxylase (fatty acid hydroxylase superfamily)
MTTPLELLFDPITLTMPAMFAAFWFSPLHTVGWTLVPSVALTLLVLPPAAATATILLITFLGIFQHADLALVDMRFGTFENPRRDEHATGFWDGARARVLDMLFARNVPRPAAPRH